MNTEEKGMEIHGWLVGPKEGGDEGEQKRASRDRLEKGGLKHSLHNEIFTVTIPRELNYGSGPWRKKGRASYDRMLRKKKNKTDA